MEVGHWSALNKENSILKLHERFVDSSTGGVVQTLELTTFMNHDEDY